MEENMRCAIQKADYCPRRGGGGTRETRIMIQAEVRRGLDLRVYLHLNLQELPTFKSEAFHGDRNRLLGHG